MCCLQMQAPSLIAGQGTGIVTKAQKAVVVYNADARTTEGKVQSRTPLNMENVLHHVQYR